MAHLGAELGLTEDQTLMVIFAEQQFIMHRTWWENGREDAVYQRMLSFYDMLNITPRQAQKLAKAATAEDDGWTLLASDLPKWAYDQVLNLIFDELP